MRLSTRRWAPVPSAFAGYRFPAEVIVVAVRWYLRYNPSPARWRNSCSSGVSRSNHVTVFRRVQRFTPLLVDAARFTRHTPGDRWFVDETYIKVRGVWRCAYRAIDQHGQVILTGHAFVQNLRRGHYELGLDVPPGRRVAVAFHELARAI